jgi:hypothetical protein
VTLFPLDISAAAHRTPAIRRRSSQLEQLAACSPLATTLSWPFLGVAGLLGVDL